MYAVLRTFTQEFYDHLLHSGELRKFNSEDQHLITENLIQLISYFNEKVQKLEEINGLKLP